MNRDCGCGLDYIVFGHECYFVKHRFPYKFLFKDGVPIAVALVDSSITLKLRLPPPGYARLAHAPAYVRSSDSARGLARSHEHSEERDRRDDAVDDMHVSSFLSQGEHCSRDLYSRTEHTV